jgi:hypothetical protein
MRINQSQFEDQPEELQAQTPKRLVSSPITLTDIYTTGLELVAIFNVPGLEPISGSYGFTCYADGVELTLGTYEVTSSNTITIPCNQVYLGQLIELNYTPGNVCDSADPANSLAEFSNLQIQNNSQVLGPPVFTEVVVNSDGVTIVATLRDYIGPLTSDGSGFVLQDGASYYLLTVASITENASIHSATIALTSASTVYTGDTIQFIYTQGNLASGSYAVADNSTVTTTNNSTQIPAPTISSASIDSTGLVFTLRFNSEATSLSGTLGLSISDNGTVTSNPFSSIIWSGTTATATSSIQIYRTDTVTLSYSSGNIQDNESNSLVAFSNLPVTNGSLIAHPMVISNPSIDASGYLWSWEVTGGILPISGILGFSGLIRTTVCNLSNITISGNTYTAIGSAQALAGQSAYISYSSGDVEDANGLTLLTTTNQYVANNSTQDGTILAQAPTITSIIGGVNSAILTITPGANDTSYSLYYSQSDTMPKTPKATGIEIEGIISINLNYPGIWYFQVAGVNNVNSALSNVMGVFVSGSLIVQNYIETTDSTALTFVGFPF